VNVQDVGTIDPGAKRLAQEARIAAEKTDNRRVKTRTLIWDGFTESDPPLRNYTIAEQRKDEAGLLLREEDQDYLRWEFDQLGEQIAKGKHRDYNEELGLPRTVDDVLAVKSLHRVLDDIEVKIIYAVHRRFGNILRTAEVLGTTRQKIKRRCPDLKR
jgi:hypothetical protein